MMMAELLLELSTILGRKATSLAHVVKRIDERPSSMMMAELPLGLSIILGRKAVPLAHLVKRIDERPISMMMAELNLELSMIMGRKKLRSIAHLFVSSSWTQALLELLRSSIGILMAYRDIVVGRHTMVLSTAVNFIIWLGKSHSPRTDCQEG